MQTKCKPIIKASVTCQVSGSVSRLLLRRSYGSTTAFPSPLDSPCQHEHTHSPGKPHLDKKPSTPTGVKGYSGTAAAFSGLAPPRLMATAEQDLDEKHGKRPRWHKGDACLALCQENDRQPLSRGRTQRRVAVALTPRWHRAERQPSRGALCHEAHVKLQLQEPPPPLSVPRAGMSAARLNRSASYTGELTPNECLNPCLRPQHKRCSPEAARREKLHKRCKRSFPSALRSTKPMAGAVCRHWLVGTVRASGPYSNKQVMFNSFSILSGYFNYFSN